MSAVTTDQTRYRSTMLGAAPFRPRRYRRRHSSQLALGRLRRALGRQAFAASATAVLVASGAFAYAIATGPLTLALGASCLVAGLAAGIGVGVFLELGRNTVTSLSSLGRHRGYAVLGAAPELSSGLLRELAPDQRTPLGCLAFKPASAFATAFRDLQGALANDHVVSFIAASPNEGASTVALCTAVSAAQQGRSVILIDCDLRRRSFTAALEHDPEVGVLEACAAPEKWSDFVDEEVETGLHFLPAAPTTSPWNTLAGADLAGLIARLREGYDLIVLDCPPALRSADGPVAANLADKCVVVAAWDETPVSALRATMRALRGGKRANTCVYVNRVPAGYRFGRLRPD